MIQKSTPNEGNFHKQPFHSMGVSGFSTLQQLNWKIPSPVALVIRLHREVLEQSHVSSRLPHFSQLDNQ